MFELHQTSGLRIPRGNLLQDMQYEICMSYIRHASQKLALRESELMLQSTLLLNSLAAHHDKSLTEHSSTEASFENRRSGCEEVLSPRAAERRAFMRKSKRGNERPTLRSRQQALQQVKEVCSEGTIAVIEVLMGEYQKIIEDIKRSDFREAFSRRKCEYCFARPPEPLHSAELEQRLKKVGGELRGTLFKNQELGKQLAQKLCELQKVKGQQQSQQVLKAHLQQKEEAAVARLHEVKMIEREILMKFEGVCQGEGCERCRSVRTIKGQLLDFKKYLQRQAQNLDKLYHRFKKSVQSIR